MIGVIKSLRYLSRSTPFLPPVVVCGRVSVTIRDGGSKVRRYYDVIRNPQDSDDFIHSKNALACINTSRGHIFQRIGLQNRVKHHSLTTLCPIFNKGMAMQAGMTLEPDLRSSQHALLPSILTSTALAPPSSSRPNNPHTDPASTPGSLSLPPLTRATKCK